MATLFPFTAIVGQDRMKRALILNAIYPQIGGVLIRGERGTAKSTAARALAALLPEIEVIEGDAFSCDPAQPGAWSEDLKTRAARGDEFKTVKRQTRFVNLPVSATEDRVVGTLDIEKAIQKGEKHFEPGVLAAANRGVLYVDEVNLLDDHVVDLLLDVAAMGVNTVEREGISFRHPARFVFIGSMNPEEGDLRPQLLDRFALCVDIVGIKDPQSRMKILERNLQFESDAQNFAEEWTKYELALREEIAEARLILPDVKYSTRDLAMIANLMATMGVDGHRADIVILRAARAHAAFMKRTNITEQDILLAAELALPHRMKRHPFHDSDQAMAMMSEKLQQIESQMEQQQMSEQKPQDGKPQNAQAKKVNRG
ncbi:MAG: ATP-binding protein [Chloroflexi bacterium]|jgi:Mg-chelatase subunit ChlI|nr:ATP-binding protein [Chloroflexota bacterium]